MNAEPHYVISVVSRVLQMHPQTLRKYERAGLVRPSRSEGMLRLYSDADLDRLRLIKRLVDEGGVNVAGVAMVLDLVDRLRRIATLAGQEGARRSHDEAAGALAAVGLRTEEETSEEEAS